MARLVEHNLGSGEGAAEIESNLRLELDHMVLEDRVDCCLLGCTHYPLVAGTIQKLYPGLPLIDPAEEMARSLKDYLDREGLGNPRTGAGALTIYTTGGPEEYALRAKQVGLERVAGVEFYPPMEVL